MSDLHSIRFSRYKRGTSRIAGFNTPMVGYRLRCACGWERRVNAPLREAEKHARAHRREHGLTGAGRDV